MIFFTAIVRESIEDNNRILFKKGETIFFTKKDNNIMAMGNYIRLTMTPNEIQKKTIPILNEKKLLHFNTNANRMANLMFKRMEMSNENKEKGTS